MGTPFGLNGGLGGDTLSFKQGRLNRNVCRALLFERSATHRQQHRMARVSLLESSCIDGHSVLVMGRLQKLMRFLLKDVERYEAGSPLPRAPLVVSRFFLAVLRRSLRYVHDWQAPEPIVFY